MNSSKLLDDIKKSGLSVKIVSEKLEEEGCPVAESTLYKKLRGVSEFNAQQIKLIAKILNYSDEDVINIFFNESVS